MRSNPLRTLMDFRVVPSTLPLQSPSPDSKNNNYSTPTISPSALEIHNSRTPLKHLRHSKNMECLDTSAKHMTQPTGNQYSSALRQKDEIITNLRRIIDMLSDNHKRKKADGDSCELRDEIRVLTIQNQKLVSLIEKFSRDKQDNTKSEGLPREDKSKEELTQLHKSYRGLAQQNKIIEDEKNQLQLENTKLLKILRDRHQVHSKLESSKLNASDVSEQSSELKITKNHEKITLLKIKEQHAENLRMQRDEASKEIEDAFDTIKMGLDSIDIKVNGMEKRLNSVEKSLWDRLKRMTGDSIPVTTNDSAPLKTGESVPVKTDENLQKRVPNKSQIYIEEVPESSSSRDKKSKHQLSLISEVEKESKAEMEQELSNVKAELQQMKFKYEKICLDGSSIASGPGNDLEDKYEQIIQQMKSKEKQIDILYAQVKNIEQDKIQEIRKQTAERQRLIAQNSIALAETKQAHMEEVNTIRSETEIKVKQLVESYEQEIEVLKKQLMAKSMNLNNFNESSTAKNSELRKIVIEQGEKMTELEVENQQLRSKEAQTTIESNRQRFLWADEKQKIEAQLNQILKEKLDLEAAKDQLEAVRDQLEQRIAEQIYEVDEGSKRMERVTADLAELEGHRNQERQELVLRIKELNTSCQKYKMEADQIRGTLKHILSHSYVDEELEKLKQTVQAQSSQIVVDSDQYSRLQSEIKTLNAQLLQRDQSNAQLIGKVVQLESLLKSHQDKWKETHEKYTESRQRLSILEQQLHAAGHTAQQNQQQILSAITKLQQTSRQSRITTMQSLSLGVE